MGRGSQLMRFDRPVHVSDLLIFAMASLSGASLGSVMNAGTALLMSALGAFVAAVAFLAARRFRLLATETIAVSLLSVMVVGGFVAGKGFPDWPRFFRAATQGWADLLTSTPPVLSRGEFLVLPFLISAFAGIAAFAIGRWSRIPGLAAVAAIALFGVGVLFGVENLGLAARQGALMLAFALGLGWIQQRTFGAESDETIGATTAVRRRNRLLGGLAMVAAATLFAPAIAPRLPGFESRQRFDLRERLEPPLQLVDRASPLIEIKQNYVGTDDVVFIIEGDSLPERLKLASLGVFDGETWTISDPDYDTRTQFDPIEAALPRDPRAPERPATPATVVTITRTEAHEGPWLPIPLNATMLRSANAELFYSAHTSMLADPAETATLTYTVTAAAPPPGLQEVAGSGGDDIFAEARAGSLAIADPLNTVTNWVADAVETTESSPISALERLQATLLSDLPQVVTGLDREARPGHSWGRLAEMVSADQVIGYEEQFAALGAIAAHLRGFQARVAVGYDLSDAAGSPVEVSRRDITAWVEVLSNDHGWLVLDVTPDTEADELPPDPPNPAIATAPQQVPEPVEFESAPARRPAEPDQEDSCDENPDECAPDQDGGLGLATPIVVTGISLAILAAPALAILALKAFVMRRRRNASLPDRRVRGAWDEANDRLLELGDRPQPRWSVTERARFTHLEGDDARRSLATLATVVDRSAFGPEAPDAVGADHAWDLYDELVRLVDQELTPAQRVRRRLNPAPLVHRTPIASRAATSTPEAQL